MRADNKPVRILLADDHQMVREGMRLLRPHLEPGARVFFVVELVPSVWDVARQLVGGREIQRFSREGVCDEVLLAGLSSPRVWLGYSASPRSGGPWASSPWACRSP